MCKVIISGYHGFIGSHLVRRLKKLKYKVIPLERNTLPGLANFDYFFHLSSYGNHYHQQDNYMTFTTNVIYLYEILLAIEDKKFKKFIYFSTSSVDLPVRTMYSTTKKMGERLCSYFAQKLPITILRPYSVYGEGEAEFRFIPKVINNSFNGEMTRVVFEPRHDWIYIDDFIDALLLVIESKGKIVPIGTGISYSNKQIVEIIDDIVRNDKTSEYDQLFYTQVNKMRNYDTRKWKADISILTKLGWKQKTTMYNGLKKVYESIKKTYPRDKL